MDGISFFGSCTFVPALLVLLRPKFFLRAARKALLARVMDGETDEPWQPRSAANGRADCLKSRAVLAFVLSRCVSATAIRGHKCPCFFPTPSP